MDTSLLYVSRSLVPTGAREDAVADIVAKAHTRNPTLGVTGALVATEAAFAQILEGPPEGVEALMSRIRRDSRHTDLTVLIEEPIPRRRFSRWALVYSGPATYVARHIEPMIADPQAGAQGERTGQLIQLMLRLSAG